MSCALTPGFPALVQEFFCERLIAQRNASRCTVASYRDAFRLLFTFAEKRLHKTPSAMSLADIDTDLLLAFLDHLETDRGNTPRSRNLRLTAIRSFMRFASIRDPTALPTAHRVLAIPAKRFDRPMLGFLSREEMNAVLSAPDSSTWSGRRDRVLLTTLYNTGARVSEIIRLQRQDVDLEQSAFVRLHGKGRKERTVPLWRTTVQSLRNWLADLPATSQQPIFPNRSGTAMSRSGVEERLDKAVKRAMSGCPALRGRSVSPHTVRHTTAMHLLQAGVDITLIALWLGHESPATTHMYVEADLQMKQRALAKVQPPSVHAFRYKPTDRLLAFLEGL